MRILLLIFSLFLVSPVYAGLTGWSTSNFLRRQAQVYDTKPYGMFCWVNRGTNSGATSAIMTVSPGTDDHSQRLNVTNTEKVSVFERDTGNSSGDTSTTLGGSTWHLAQAGFIGSAEREAYLDGAGRAANTGTRNPNASTRLHIGVRGDEASAAFYATGGIAQCSIWNFTGMSQANREALAAKLFNGGSGGNGANPLAVTAEAAQPWTGALVAYWRLNNTSDLTDLSGNGHDLSMVGTLTNFASHPLVDPVAGAARARSQTIVAD